MTNLKITLALFSAALAFLVAPSAQAAPDKTAKPGWTLTFDDEFNGSKLDTAKWIDSYPDNSRTHNNGEQEYYAPDGYAVSHGALHLKGERRPQGGMPYTSGMVASYGKFAQQYGWFEMRAKLPAGKGMWPAFWLLPADKNWPPEIDILEMLGHEPSKVYLTNHWQDAAGKHQSHGENFVGPDFSRGFHTFAVDWEADSIVWYIDGTERSRSTEGIPTMPMYLLANLAVGGDWPGNPDATTPFPGLMDIDYIRVYQKPKATAAYTLMRVPVADTNPVQFVWQVRPFNPGGGTATETSYASLSSPNLRQWVAELPKGTLLRYTPLALPLLNPRFRPAADPENEIAEFSQFCQRKGVQLGFYPRL